MFLHRSIFSWKNRKQIPAEYTCLAMIISSLYKIGVNLEDRIIIAVDGRNSWRKDIDPAYKGNRKAFRQSFSDIPWDEMYMRFDILLDDIYCATNWAVIKIDRIEADDIMAVGCRYFKDEEIVLVTFDSDLEQMWEYPNVKIFSPTLKPKRYKVKPPKFSAHKLIAKKIIKEASDNLISPLLTEKDYDDRNVCVNLLELPDFVEVQIIDEFKKLKDREYNVDHIGFTTMAERLDNLYGNKSKIITYEKCIKMAERKEKIKKNKLKKKRESKNVS